MREAGLMKLIEVRASELGARLFRNNVAKAWIGKHIIIKRYTEMVLEPGDVVVKDARRLHAGLCEGSSDLIGWKPVEVTQDMVGKKVAAFVAAEVKTRTGRATKKQKNFVEKVGDAGGLAGIVRSIDDIEDLLS